MRLVERNLLRAARSGKTQRLAQLVRDGGDVNCCGPDGQTPLIFAAWAGHEEAVRCLLGAGANPQARAQDGATALFAAVARRHSCIVALLLEHGADPNACRDSEAAPRPGDPRGYSPLHAAISHGDPQIARMLVEGGARADHVWLGKDALESAAAKGLSDLVAWARKRVKAP